MANRRRWTTLPSFDDRLTRELERVARPADPSGVLDRVTARRQRRATVRKAQAVFLAFSVLAATAGGFALLREAFDQDGRGSGDNPIPTASSPNGEIVFSREGDDGHLHVFSSNADGTGLHQITEGPTDDSGAAVSPDGQTVAFVRILDERTQGIATVGIGGGEATQLTAELNRAADPAWSPSGTTLAYVTTGTDSQQLATIDVGSGEIRNLIDVFGQIASPTWSPDGTQIALGVVSDGSPGSIRTVRTNTMMEGSPEGSLSVGSAPAWSPDGSKIALIRPGDEGDEIWTIAPDGSSETLMATWVEGSLQPDLAWAPDGNALLVSDSTWIYRVDAAPEGDPRDNFERLVEGTSPAWRPLPVESEPSVTTNPAPEGRDIGLGVGMCDVEILEGIDWDGTGIDGAAWTGAPVGEDGRCSSTTGVQHIVAVDRDGDGIAEQGSTSTLRSCLLCRPFDTVDLNDDGVLELVVLEEASSTPTYAVFEVNRPGSERAEGVYPITVVAPGAPAMNLDANEAVRFMVGGDEGFSGSIACEDGGAGPPILRYTWVRGAVDDDTQLRVDITELRFGEDGVFHIESIDRFSVPRDPEPTELTSTASACGVDFHPAA